MPLPAALQARLHDPDFWRAYAFEPDPDADPFEDAADDEPPAVTVEFPVGGGYALVLDIDVALSMVNLGVRTQAPADTQKPGSASAGTLEHGPASADRPAPGLDSVGTLEHVPASADRPAPGSDSVGTLELGWDDEAHWHPDALRWSELDLIGRAAAVLDPSLPHPGPVLALAARFVILDPGDDLDAITPLMDAAYGPPPPGATFWPRTRDWLHSADGRHDGVRWQRDAAGNWTVDQEEGADVDRTLYSTRRPDGEFPFAAWQQLLSAAESTLANGTLPTPDSPIEQYWTEEAHTGVARGSLIAARCGPSPLRDSRRYQLELALPVEGRPTAHARNLRADLDRVLRDADRGWAEHSGSTSAPGRGYTEEHLTVAITDDLDAGIALIREALHRHDADPGAQLTRGNQPVPLS
ncbi:hypothetical protein OHA21_21000 [Actinoplanes sp. NBC_00393]|uniref:hypothetical protein n=1 Tax=Actinoplanes sp. NBC_00393 TaxID=2975953 RepID=UPI002E1E8811